MDMLNFGRIPIVLLTVLVAVAPCVDAAMVQPVSICPMMAAVSAAAHHCCGADCECSIEASKNPLSQDIPVQQPAFKLDSAAFEPRPAVPGNASVSTVPTAEESPPHRKNPLYQEYSDYRL